MNRYHGLPVGYCKPSSHDARTLLFSKYVKDDALTAPASCDYGSKISQWLLLLNNVLGDCVVAAVLHIIMAVRSNNGITYTPDDDTAKSLYETRCGYVDGNAATDQGANELDILKGWRTSAIENCGLLAFAAVDPTNWEHVKLALYLSGALLMAVNLPASAQSETIWSNTFDAPGTWDDSGYAGHAMAAVAYSDNTGTGILGRLRALFSSAILTAITWGAKQPLTKAWLAKYCTELWVPITKDWFNAQGIAPNFLNMQALLADLAAATSGPTQ